MKRYFLFITIFPFVLLSCSKTKQVNLLEIPVDIDQNSSFPLSEISENITKIDLEFSDESLINPDMIQRITVTENDIIIAEMSKILIFNKDGKFVRSIGSRGQGPGEYNHIMSMAMDEKNKRLFIVSSGPWKIICYDMDGNFLKEFATHSMFEYIVDINYINGDLLLINQNTGEESETGRFTSSTVYRLTDDFRVTDSCIIRKNVNVFIFSFLYKDFILKGNTSVNLYYCESYGKTNPPREVVVRDTLYRFERNRLVPELTLKFKNNGIDGGGNKFIDPYSIFRSSRYVFSIYENYKNGNRYYFCFDTKTGKGYNMQDGFTDDINGIDKRVSIRPFNYDTEMFYYLYTYIKPDDFEEKNPTLYIGKLKK